MKNLILTSALFLSGCSTTIIYAPKTIKVYGNGNKIELKGSDLKENELKQASEGRMTPI
jgi:hypothetical protein